MWVLRFFNAAVIAGYFAVERAVPFAFGVRWMLASGVAILLALAAHYRPSLGNLQLVITSALLSWLAFEGAYSLFPGIFPHNLRALVASDTGTRAKVVDLLDRSPYAKLKP